MHESRYEDIAANAANLYGHFPCHKTTASAEDGENEWGKKTLTCAGHTQLKCEANDLDLPSGMEYSDKVFDYYEMSEAYEHWDGA